MKNQAQHDPILCDFFCSQFICHEPQRSDKHPPRGQECAPESRVSVRRRGKSVLEIGIRFFFKFCGNVAAGRSGQQRQRLPLRKAQRLLFAVAGGGRQCLVSPEALRPTRDETWR